MSPQAERETTINQTPEERRRDIRRLVLRGGLAVVGTTLLAACTGSGSPKPESSPTVAPTAAPADTLMEAQLRFLPPNPTEEELRKISDLFLKQNGSIFIDHRQRLEAGQPVAPMFAEGRRHLAAGLEIISRSPRAKYLAREADSIFRTAQNIFDLADPTDFFLGAEIINLLVQENLDQKTKYGYVNPHNKTEIEALKGSITIQEAEIPPFALSSEELVLLSRTQGALSHGGKSIPPIWKPVYGKDPDKSGAGFDPKTNIMTFHPFRMHDLIWDSYLEQAYEDWFNQFKAVIENRPSRINIDLTDYSFHSGIEGKWRSFMRFYLEEGIGLRRRIAWLLKDHSPEAHHLNDQYQVGKAGFGGWESNDNILAVINDGKFSKGDQVIIRDLWPDQLGEINLHPNPTVKIDNDGKNKPVPANTRASIIADIVTARDDDYQQQADLAKVETESPHEIAWITTEWLEKVF